METVKSIFLLPTGSKEREVLGVGSVPVAIFASCHNVEDIASYLYKHVYRWVVKIRNTSEAVLGAPIQPFAIILTPALRALVSKIAQGRIVILILPPLCLLY